MRVALGHVAGALLVTHEDVTDRGIDERVVDGQDRTTRKAEHDLGLFHLETSDERLGAGDLHRVLTSSSSLPGEAGKTGPGYKKPLARARGGGARARERGRALRNDYLEEEGGGTRHHRDSLTHPATQRKG